MYTNPPRQPLIRISKNGEMRLKNKVSVAILKENAYEERSLGTQLKTLKKHQARQDKYMTYRQLEFATKQIAVSEERPVTIAVDTRRESCLQGQSGLPPIQTMAARRTTSMFTNQDFSKVETDPNRRTQGNWEKAVAMVRMAVQNRKPDEFTKTEDKTFITRKLESEEHGAVNAEDTTLPPLSRHHQLPTRAKKGQKISRRLTFPEMIKVSREKSMIGLHDPRFLKLESCLGGEQNAKSARGRLMTTRTIDTNSSDPLRKRKLRTS